MTFALSNRRIRPPTYDQITKALDGFSVETVLASHGDRRMVAVTMHMVYEPQPITVYQVEDGKVKTGYPNLKDAIHAYCS